MLGPKVVRAPLEMAAASLSEENISLLLFQAAMGYPPPHTHTPNPADQQRPRTRIRETALPWKCRVSLAVVTASGTVLCCLHRGQADFPRSNIIFPSEGVLLRDNKQGGWGGGRLVYTSSSDG